MASGASRASAASPAPISSRGAGVRSGEALATAGAEVSSKIDDNHQFGSNLFVTARAAYYNTGFILDPIGGLATQAGQHRLIALLETKYQLRLRRSHPGHRFVDHRLEQDAGAEQAIDAKIPVFRAI